MFVFITVQISIIIVQTAGTSREQSRQSSGDVSDANNKPVSGSAPSCIEKELIKNIGSLFENNTKAIIWGQQQKAVQVDHFTLFTI